MKSLLHILKLTGLVSCLVFTVAHFSYADEDDEDRPEMTLAQAQTFLKEYLPEAIELLNHVRDNESIEDYQEALERAVEAIEEYQAIREDDGKEQAELFLQGIRLELQIEQLALQWHTTDDDNLQDQLREQLTTKVSELFEHELKVSIQELKFLREEIVTIEGEIENLEKNRDVLINEEVKEILDE